MDLRCAALTQMLSMTPTNLTRCIAPRLQLWASGRNTKDAADEYDDKDDCPIFDMIDLRTEAVQLAMPSRNEGRKEAVWISETKYFCLIHES
jgi:hypothetical protein